MAPGFLADQSNRLNRQRQRALAEQQLHADVRTSSPCRKVSLRGLESALTAMLSQPGSISVDLRCLAGLQRIDYIFLDKGAGDVILAGPAEAFAPDETGRQRGVESGRPTLLLDDLLVAFRSVSGGTEVGCSIDPQPENLVALSRFVSQNSSPTTPNVIEGRFRQMAATLGTHDVRIMGVPEDSHFGRVLVEADYRMKLISMGLENPGVKGLRSHLSMLKGGGNSIQRWWLVPLYDSLACDAQREAFELTGPRVQLLSQEELTNAAGERSAAATTRLTTQAFAQQFTQHYPTLADQSPVFGELQNLIDLCVVAALAEQEGWRQSLKWDMALLRDEQQLPHAAGNIPTKVAAMANAKRVSSGLVVGLVGGGVTIRPRELVSVRQIQVALERRLDAERTSHLAGARPTKHAWWWD